MMDRRFKIDTQENKEYLKKLGEELLMFGRRFPSKGGSSYYLGTDGTPCKDLPRETWITSRMVHVYSVAALLHISGCKELAEAGIKGLLGELYDMSNGGWYAGLDKEDKPLPTKQCYAHAFVILAGSSGVLADIEGAGELLDRALLVFDERFWDEEEGLCVDTWNTDFSVLDDYRGLNANMHTVEAFLAAYDATSDKKYLLRAGRIIDRVIKWAGDNNWRIPEHFSKEWIPLLEYNSDNKADQFKPYGATPGHGIEWGRLIVQWVECADFVDKKIKDTYIQAATYLYDRAIKDSWHVDGEEGLVYTTDWSGEPIVHDRMHWTLAEAINTSSVLYRATHDDKYAKDYCIYLRYLEEKVRDKRNGSWYHQLDSRNSFIETVWPGKPDIYHAYQATLIPVCRIDKSIAAAVKWPV